MSMRRNQWRRAPVVQDMRLHPFGASSNVGRPPRAIARDSIAWRYRSRRSDRWNRALYLDSWGSALSARTNRSSQPVRATAGADTRRCQRNRDYESSAAFALDGASGKHRPTQGIRFAADSDCFQNHQQPIPRGEISVLLHVHSPRSGTVGGLHPGNRIPTSGRRDSAGYIGQSAKTPEQIFRDGERRQLELETGGGPMVQDCAGSLAWFGTWHNKPMPTDEKFTEIGTKAKADKDEVDQTLDSRLVEMLPKP